MALRYDTWEEMMDKLYVDKGGSAKAKEMFSQSIRPEEIAIYFEVSVGTVFNWLRKYRRSFVDGIQKM